MVLNFQAFSEVQGELIECLMTKTIDFEIERSKAKLTKSSTNKGKLIWSKEKNGRVLCVWGPKLKDSDEDN